MNYNNDIERLKRELQNTKIKQSNLEKSCNHQWDTTKFDPEDYQDAIFSHYEGHGSDPNPVYNYYTKKKDRWSRICKNCGKKEYTYIKAPVQYEPKF